MAIAKITGQGLTSIAILVALLWTCLLSERAISSRARAVSAETVRAMRELRLRQRGTPAAAPLRPRPRPRRRDT